VVEELVGAQGVLGYLFEIRLCLGVYPWASSGSLVYFAELQPLNEFRAEKSTVKKSKWPAKSFGS